MEKIAIMVAAGLLGGLVTMGLVGMVQEIMKHKKDNPQPKERKKKEKQI